MIVLSKFNVFTTDRAIGSKGKKMENLEMESTNSRRTFLKKVAYVAPAVIVLGGLSAQASPSAAASTFAGDYTVHPPAAGKKIADMTVSGNTGTNTVTGGTYTPTSTGVTQTVSASDIVSQQNGIWAWIQSYFSGPAHL